MVFSYVKIVKMLEIIVFCRLLGNACFSISELL